MNFYDTEQTPYLSRIRILELMAGFNAEWYALYPHVIYSLFSLMQVGVGGVGLQDPFDHNWLIFG
jgi:hypothetical protein